MGKELILSWDEIEKDVIWLSEKIKKTSLDFKGLVSVSRGGLIPTGLLSRHLDITIIENISIESYTEGNQQSKLKQTTYLDLSKKDKGKGWLVIDDLVDTGETFNYIKNILPEATFCSVYAKPKGEKSTDIFSKSYAQDIWLTFPWEL